MRDVVHARAEGVKPGGAITERLTYCDAGYEGVNNRGNRGGAEFGSTGWCELNGILMAMEIPGIYLRTDKNEMYVFDHVVAKILKRSKEEIVISIKNPTSDNANVSVFAESMEDAGRPLRSTAFLQWPKVEVKAGATVLFSIGNDRKK